MQAAEKNKRSSMTARKSKTARPPAAHFLEKLCTHVLQDIRYADVMAWTEAGDYITLNDDAQLLSTLPNCLFRRGCIVSYTSFSRQLRHYGFRKLRQWRIRAVKNLHSLPRYLEVWQHAHLTRDSSLAEVRAVRPRATAGDEHGQASMAASQDEPVSDGCYYETDDENEVESDYGEISTSGLRMTLAASFQTMSPGDMTLVPPHNSPTPLVEPSHDWPSMPCGGEDPKAGQTHFNGDHEAAAGSPTQACAEIICPLRPLSSVSTAKPENGLHWHANDQAADAEELQAIFDQLAGRLV